MQMNCEEKRASKAGMLLKLLAAMSVSLAVVLPRLAHGQIVPIPSLLLPALPTAPEPTYTFDGPIEAKYAHTGPWAVSMIETADACDIEGHTCFIYYPTKLGFNAQTGQNGFKHPVIAWASGTIAAPHLVAVEHYDQYLRHLASWGFVVVMSRDGWTTRGNTAAEAATYMVRENARAGGLFRNKLDTANMGMGGHSQGGGAAAALLAAQSPLFKAYLSAQGAGQIFGGLVISNLYPDTPMSTGLTSLSDVTQGSILYVNSLTDHIVSGLDAALLYYQTTSDSIDKVMGVLTTYGHETVRGNPGCATPEACAANPYRGLSVAWFLWKLRGIDDAHSMFRPGGEFSRSTLLDPDWFLKMSNVQ
jgi:hypothetical protein